MSGGKRRTPGAAKPRLFFRSRGKSGLQAAFLNPPPKSKDIFARLRDKKRNLLTQISMVYFVTPRQCYILDLGTLNASLKLKPQQVIDDNTKPLARVGRKAQGSPRDSRAAEISETILATRLLFCRAKPSQATISLVNGGTCGKATKKPKKIFRKILLHVPDFNSSDGSFYGPCGSHCFGAHCR